MVALFQEGKAGCLLVLHHICGCIANINKPWLVVSSSGICPQICGMQQSRLETFKGILWDDPCHVSSVNFSRKSNEYETIGGLFVCVCINYNIRHPYRSINQKTLTVVSAASYLSRVMCFI